MAVFLIALIPSLGLPYWFGLKNPIALLVLALVVLMPFFSGVLIKFSRSTLPLRLQPYDPTQG
jgi:hypothetical protein